MPDPTVLQELVSDVSRQIRARRAEYYGLRGLFAGAVVALVPLCLRDALGPLGLALAGALVAAGLLAGALYGLLLKVPAVEVARLADRGYGLQDRVATALEWARRPDRTPLVEALVADAAASAKQLQRRRIVARRFPREARLLPLPLLVGVLLALMPPI